MHPKLIELGFLEFVKMRRIAGSERLFDLRENTRRAGDYTKEPSRFFTEYRRSKGVTGLPEIYNESSKKWEGGKSSKTFHSFRTTAITKMRHTDVPLERRKRLVGHAESEVHNDTYRPEELDAMFLMPILLEDISKLQFSINFSLPPKSMR
jgi:hypothetical protein